MIKDWEIKSIEEIAKTTSGGTPSRTNKSYYTGNILWVKSGELDDNYISDTEEKITEEAVINSSAKIFQKGTVLMAMYGATVGKTAILKVPATTNQAVCGMIPNPKECNNEFLRFQLMYKREDFLKQRYGGAQPNISQTIIRTFDILLPPLPEQSKIAYILSTVQKAIEQQDKLIRHTTELKKALMQKLFTEGTKGEKQKQTEIGLVPESWEVQPFENTGDVVYGIQAAVASNLKPIGHKILTNKNITLEGKIDLEKINYFELTSKRHFDTILKKGDLLFNWRSGSKEHVGKTAIFDLEDAEYVHSSFILRIRVNKNHNAKFLFYYLNYLREIGYYQKVQTFSINAKFNKSAINSMPIALPKRNVQDLIANTIEAIDNKIDNQKNNYNIKNSMFKTLLHELMTGERRVHEIEFEALNKAYRIKEQPLSMAAEK
ncbi:MAG TPA: restriction endonuclease subunit S [Chitinophagaceae bacterium]|jgi:type I restriction enzyme S subunit|nr:restriction endonuclease subunit S [Chitinophagaceae bacterium]